MIGLLFLLLGLCASAFAETPTKPTDPLNRYSPQSAVYSFLEACHSHDYTRASKYLDLRRLPEDQRVKDGPQLAQQLEKVLDRDAQFDVAALSRDPAGDHRYGSDPNREVVTSFKVNGQAQRLELARVDMHSGTSVWLFSSDSVERIPQLAVMVSDSPIERFLPALLVNYKVLDTSVWRWIALVLLIMVLGAVSGLLSRVGMVVLVRPLLKRFAPKLSASVLDEFVSPLRLLLSIALFRAAMVWIGPSALLRMWLERTLALLFFFALGWLSMGIVDVAIAETRTLLVAKQRAFSYSVLPLISRILKVTVFFLAAAAVLGNWGYNTTTILAGLGVGGIAIALAAQKTIENFFGGVSVIGDRTVAVGDFCKFGDRAGTVEDIGLRSTRIRTTDRTVVIVPNSAFSTMTVENFESRDKMLFHFTLSLLRNTTPEQVRALLKTISNILREQPKVEAGAVPVRFIGVGAYSLDLEIFAYITTRDGDEFMTLQQDLLLRILDAVKAAGTALAIPTQASINYSGEAPAPPVRVGPAMALNGPSAR
jgi:MscS family membrane protein